MTNLKRQIGWTKANRLGLNEMSEHDCHLSPEEGCEACDEAYRQKMDAKYDELKEDESLSEGMCQRAIRECQEIQNDILSGKFFGL